MLYYACAKWGPLAYIDEPNSVYRITGEGDSSGRPAEKVLEIALKHRFEFNQQLGFPNNRALIKVQVSVILPNLYKNFSITQVRKTIRLLKQYKVNNGLYYPFYFFYSTFYILDALIRKVSQRNIVSQKSL